MFYIMFDIETSSGIEYATFQFYENNYMLYKHYTLTRCLNWVSRVDWLMVIVQDIKKQCNNVIHGLFEKLEKRFPSQKIINATNIIYF